MVICSFRISSIEIRGRMSKMSPKCRNNGHKTIALSIFYLCNHQSSLLISLTHNLMKLFWKFHDNWIKTSNFVAVFINDAIKRTPCVKYEEHDSDQCHQILSLFYHYGSPHLKFFWKSWKCTSYLARNVRNWFGDKLFFLFWVDKIRQKSDSRMDQSKKITLRHVPPFSVSPG